MPRYRKDGTEYTPGQRSQIDGPTERTEVRVPASQLRALKLLKARGKIPTLQVGITEALTEYLSRRRTDA